MDADRHPAHDELSEEVARWFRDSTPEMGYEIAAGRYGWFHRPSSTGRGRGTVRRDLRAADVDAMVAEAGEIIGGGSLELACDDRATAREVGPALEARGFEQGTTTVFLAFIGEPREFDEAHVDGLTIEPVTAESDRLQTWVTVKRQAFVDSEAPVPASELGHELAIRKTELAGQGRLLAASIKGEMVAICAFYEDTDRFVFLLGTRVPFRHRGIGRALLGHVVRGAANRGCRSVVINGDEDGQPIAMYRRLGFVDEVHWRRSWQRHAPGA